jgi:cytochrome c oxidase subunit 2
VTNHDRCVAALLWTLYLAGCNTVQTTQLPQGEQALAIDFIWRSMLWVCGIFYAAVLLGLVLALTRRRHDARPGVDLEKRQDRTIERGLVAWTALVALSLAGLTAASFAVDRRLSMSNGGDVRIRVTAKQWWWQVEYLHDEPSLNFTTANEIVLPVGREARLALEASDVIHTLWIPNLAGKRDMIPGRHNQLSITPLEAGDFRGQCAEFCGLQHAHMALDVHVLAGDAFEHWREAQRKPAAMPRSDLARRGQQVFMSKPCSTCHTITGTDAGSRTGPDLTHVASRSTLAAGTLPMRRDQVRAWIKDPQAYKPGANMPRVELSDVELDAVTAYLVELE